MQKNTGKYAITNFVKTLHSRCGGFNPKDFFIAIGFRFLRLLTWLLSKEM